MLTFAGPATCERLVEAARLTRGLVRVDDALRGGLVVGLLGLVAQSSSAPGVAGFHRPVEVLGEVAQASVNGLVLLVLLEALLVALGRCGHALAPSVI